MHGCWRRTAAASKPHVHGPGVVRLHLQLRGQGRHNPPTGQLRLQLTYRDHGSNPIGSSFSIQGTADTLDPLLESMICIGQEPPIGGNTLIFVGHLPADDTAADGFPPDVPEA